MFSATYKHYIFFNVTSSKWTLFSGPKGVRKCVHDFDFDICGTITEILFFLFKMVLLMALFILNVNNLLVLISSYFQAEKWKYLILNQKIAH